MKFHITLSTFATITSAFSLEQKDIKDIVAFGDSLSDNGNSQALNGLPKPPYANGHWTNGNVWVEYLSQLFGNATLHDFAYGGAVANITDASNVTQNIPDLAAQLALYQKDAASQKLSPNSTLYTVWAGGNDLDYAATTGKVPDPAAIA
ncbi:hypothetical protein BC830DRAFT_1175107, partial [Chytriomyces sp. MP71]